MRSPVPAQIHTKNGSPFSTIQRTLQDDSILFIHLVYNSLKAIVFAAD